MNIIYHAKKKIQDFKYRKVVRGRNSRINLGVNINLPEQMLLGDNSYINGGVFSITPNSQIIIGSDCLISYNVHFRTFSHIYSSKHKLIRKQGEFEKDIIVKDDVWVGYGAQIMPGITLNQGCVVAAGAVVTHDVPSYAVVAGIPAQVIKYRT